MSLEFYNKLRTYCIQMEYKFISNYLLQVQYHVNYLNDYNMISLYERNLFIGKIYEQIKNLNNSYNEEILNDNKEIPNNIDKYIDLEYSKNNLSIEETYNYLQRLSLVIENIPLLQTLNTIRKNVIELTSQYGNNKINLILNIVINKNLKIFYDKSTIELLNFLDNIFIPIKFSFIDKNFFSNYMENLIKSNVSDNSSDSMSMVDKKDDIINEYFKDINIFRKETNDDDLLERIICIELRLENNKTFLIEGILDIDSMNIILKTCQIANKFIYLKKKKFRKNS